MARPDFEKYIVRDGTLFVRHPRIYIDPEKGFTTKIEEIPADPFHRREFEDLQNGRPTPPEPPQELAQNE